jgi:hypothetical protein
MSVFAAWQVSISAIPHNIGKFLHLLCFLDRTNLTMDFFKRACYSKNYWNDQGNTDILLPTKNHVPNWLLELFCDHTGQWNELQFHKTVRSISSLFFIRKTKYTGTWIHKSAPIESPSLNSDGRPDGILLVLPQPLHDLGKFYHNEEDQRMYCQNAFSVIVHAFRNDIIRDGTENGDRDILMPVGLGGAVARRQLLELQLEESYRHILAFKDYAWKDYAPYLFPTRDTSRPGTLRCFDSSLPSLQCCEAIMFASVFWAEPTSASWPEIIGISEYFLARVEPDTLPRTTVHPSLLFEDLAYTVPDDEQGFKHEWVKRAAQYHKKLRKLRHPLSKFRKEKVKVAVKYHSTIPIYELAAMAEKNLAACNAHDIGILVDADFILNPRVYKFIDDDGSLLMTWTASGMARDILRRAGAQDNEQLSEVLQRDRYGKTDSFSRSLEASREEQDFRAQCIL